MALHVAFLQAYDELGLVGSKLRRDVSNALAPILKSAPYNAPLLITGPPKSGKSLVAQAAHTIAAQLLKRRGPFVTCNGSALQHDSQHNLHAALQRAQGGTLLLQQSETLPASGLTPLLAYLDSRLYPSICQLDPKQNVLVILSSQQSAARLSQRQGPGWSDLVARTHPALALPPVHKRGSDIAELVNHFVGEHRQAHTCDLHGFSRQAQSDLELALRRHDKINITTMQQAVHAAATQMHHASPSDDVISSAHLAPILKQAWGYKQQDQDRQARDQSAVENGGLEALLSMTRLKEVAGQHHVSSDALAHLCQALQGVISEMDDQPRSYRNIVERQNRLAKIALWLVSGAENQAQFRRFFGNLQADQPPKSVAHQIYYQVYPKQEHGSA